MNETAKLHFQEWGSGHARKLLFLHGFLGSLWDWEEIIAWLAPDYRCLAIDLPGHGATAPASSPHSYTMEGTAQAVLHIMDAAEASGWTLIGYSMGGRLALYMAVHYPERCAALVVESASPGIQESHSRRERRESDKRWARLLEQDAFGSFLRAWYQQPLFHTLMDSPAVFDRILARREKNNPEELARSLLGMSPGLVPSLWHELPRITAPVLLLAGEMDLRYKQIARKVARRLARPKLAWVPQSGHNGHAENPRAFTSLLRSFLNQQG